MSFVARLQENLQPTPSRDFVKIGTLIRKCVIANSLEKTAAVQTKIAEQETKILVSFYKAAHALSPDSHVAEAFFSGGAHLYGANNFGGEPSGDSLYKLAAVGMVNDKLQTALKTPGLTKEAQEHISKLGRENNHHTLALLADLVLTKEGEGKGSGSAGSGSAGSGSAGSGSAGSAELRDARTKNVAETFARPKDGGGSAPDIGFSGRVTAGLKADKTVNISGARSNGAPGGGGGMMTGGGKTTVNHVNGPSSRSISDTDSTSGIGASVGSGSGAPKLKTTPVGAATTNAGIDTSGEYRWARGMNSGAMGDIKRYQGEGKNAAQIKKIMMGY